MRAIETGTYSRHDGSRLRPLRAMLQAWYNANLSQPLGTDFRHAPERSTPWSTQTTVQRPLPELAKYGYFQALTVASKKLSPLLGFGRDTTVSAPPSLAGEIICTTKFYSGEIVRNHRRGGRVGAQRRRGFHLCCARSCIAHALRKMYLLFDRVWMIPLADLSSGGRASRVHIHGAQQ